ncbi:FAA hydrolase family protein, partial [bacterium]|nr:FAA hydrolase family protein [bacterium]
MKIELGKNMKLGSLKSGRDGILVVVDKKLTKAVKVESIAKTMQIALDSWKEISPKLIEVYEQLNSSTVEGEFSLVLEDLAATLP